MQLDRGKLCIVVDCELGDLYSIDVGQIILIEEDGDDSILYETSIEQDYNSDTANAYRSEGVESEVLPKKEVNEFIDKGYLMPLPKSYIPKLVRKLGIEGICL